MLLGSLNPGGGLFYLAVDLSQSVQPGQALLYRIIKQRGKACRNVGNGDIQDLTLFYQPALVGGSRILSLAEPLCCLQPFAAFQRGDFAIELHLLAL